MPFGMGGGQNVIEVVIRAKDEASKEIQNTSRAFGGLDKQFAITAGAITAAGAAAGAALIKMARDTAVWGHDLQLMSERLNISVTDLSRLQYLAERTDTTLEAMATGFRLLAKSAAAASTPLDQLGEGIDETGEALSKKAEIFARLGVSVTDSAGKLRPINDIFLDLAGSAKLASSETQWLADVTGVLGRGAMQLVPLLKMDRSEIEELIVRLDYLGGTMGGELAQKSAEYMDSTKDLKAAWRGLKTESEPLLGILEGINKVLIEGTLALRDQLQLWSTMREHARNPGGWSFGVGYGSATPATWQGPNLPPETVSVTRMPRGEFGVPPGLPPGPLPVYMPSGGGEGIWPPGWRETLGIGPPPTGEGAPVEMKASQRMFTDAVDSFAQGLGYAAMQATSFAQAAGQAGAMALRELAAAAITAAARLVAIGVFQAFTSFIGGGTPKVPRAGTSPGTVGSRGSVAFAPAAQFGRAAVIINYPAHESHADRVRLARDVQEGLLDAGVAGYAVEP